MDAHVDDYQWLKADLRKPPRDDYYLPLYELMREDHQPIIEPCLRHLGVTFASQHLERNQPDSNCLSFLTPPLGARSRATRMGLREAERRKSKRCAHPSTPALTHALHTHPPPTRTRTCAHALFACLVKQPEHMHQHAAKKTASHKVHLPAQSQMFQVKDKGGATS